MGARTLLLASAFSLAAGLAAAQDAPRGPAADGPYDRGDRDRDDRDHRDGDRDRRAGDRDRDDDGVRYHHRGQRMHGDKGRHRQMRRHAMHHRGMASAGFHLRLPGGVELRVNCGMEPISACLGAIQPLVDSITDAEAIERPSPPAGATPPRLQLQ